MELPLTEGNYRLTVIARAVGMLDTTLKGEHSFKWRVPGNCLLRFAFFHYCGRCREKISTTIPADFPLCGGFFRSRLGAWSRRFLYDFGSRLAIGSRAKNWQVLGVDFDDILQAASYSEVASGNVAASAANLPEAKTEFARMPASQADKSAGLSNDGRPGCCFWPLRRSPRSEFGRRGGPLGSRRICIDESTTGPVNWSQGRRWQVQSSKGLRACR